MRYLLCIVVILVTTPAWTQARCENQDFNKKVQSYLKGTVPQIDVSELAAATEGLYILDAREIKEFQVSHIPGARHVGYKHFDVDSIRDIPKDARVVIYCSIGYRSEIIGNKLQSAGYKNVQNLYGSIFEWANRGYALVQEDGTSTSRVHTYSRSWSKWLLNKDYQKTW